MGNHYTTKVAILGAGPAGATSALFLNKAGIDCILIDRATFPRDKICGDALSGKVAEILKKLDPELVDRMAKREDHLPCYGVNFIAPNVKSLRVPFKKDYTKGDEAVGFIATRVDFDNFLFQEAKAKQHVQTLENTQITQWEKTPNGYTLRAKNGDSIHCNLLLVCDGAHSKFARKVGGIVKENDHYCAGLRAYYKNVSGMDKDNFIELHFLKDFLPGYFWIFPLPDGHANVGVGMRSDKVASKKVDLKKRMQEIIHEYPELKERFKDAELVDDIKGFGLPMGSKKRSISGDNYCLLGDAGSLIDPFTGEGIGNAVICAYYAAEAAEKSFKNMDFSAKTLKTNYDKAVYYRLWPELNLSKKMQELVRFPWLFNFVVNKARKNKTLRDTISVMFEDIDLRERFKKPSFYFKLLFSNGN